MKRQTGELSERSVGSEVTLLETQFFHSPAGSLWAVIGVPGASESSSVKWG